MDILKLGKQFLGEMGDFIKKGMPVVTEEQYQKRLEACKACPNLQEKTPDALSTCGLCGCVVAAKARMGTSKCPDNPERWDPIEVSPEQTKTMEIIENKINKQIEEQNAAKKKARDAWDREQAEDHARWKEHMDPILKRRATDEYKKRLAEWKKQNASYKTRKNKGYQK